MRDDPVAQHRLDAFAQLAYIYGDFTVDDDPEWAVEMVDWMLEDPGHWVWSATVAGVAPPARRRVGELP